jgi:hypothetical protein
VLLDGKSSGLCPPGSVFLLCASSVLSFAGLCGGAASDPCDLDSLSCQANLFDFAYDPDCDLTGALELELGHGEYSFTNYLEGEVPEAIQGGQGGQHLFGAIRVLNAATTKYDKLLVRIGVYTECLVGESCFEPEGGVFECTLAGSDVGEGICGFTNTERIFVLGSAKPFRVVSEGVLEEFGLVMVLDSWPIWGSEGVVRLTVVDPCERSGMIEHRFPGTNIDFFDTGTE